MTGDNTGRTPSIEEAREKYRIEREKRLRTEGNAQYKELAGDYEEFDRDPYADPDFTRDPITEETEVVVVGGGFAGMLTGIKLTKLGIRDFKIVEKAGDFGGTWYWNRYPGCMCDVESYTYLPLLEETGFMPTERYAKASEIFGYCQQLGRTFDLYPNALFQTIIDDIVWDDVVQRWQVSTSRGDRLSARFVVIAGGILHKAKLPGIPGIETFQGKAFHTSRWDYSYTGGSNTEPMTGLADKRVGIVGTGATAIQAVPRLAEAAKELFVFQRTPSAVGVRDNRKTDVAWFESLPKGWQAERIHNFTESVTGVQPAIDMVQDGWTQTMWVDTRRGGSTPEESAELEAEDFGIMQGLRDRVDSIIEDPDTAERLKPWYGKNCKRICFHDEYLPTFNRPNVHLVDTEGRGVERITPTGAVVDGVEYPLDLLVFASGFEIQTDYEHRLGFDPKGRDGVSLSQHWAEGPRTLHGVMAAGFPNMLMISLTQSSFGTNFVHFLSNSAEHAAQMVAECRQDGIVVIEPTRDAEDAWLQVLYGDGSISKVGSYYAACTPGYYTSEGVPDMAKAARNLGYPGNLIEYAAHLEGWRADGRLEGTTVVREDRPA